MRKEKSTVTQMMMVETLAHGDLGQAALHFFQEWFAQVGIVFTKGNQRHGFAQSGDAQHEGAHKTLVFFDIVKAQSLLQGNAAYGVADFVGGVRLEPAVFEVDYFVKTSSGVKAQHIGGVADPGFDFGVGQPFFAREGKFHFVAVIKGTFGTKNR